MYLVASPIKGFDLCEEKLHLSANRKQLPWEMVL